MKTLVGAFNQEKALEGAFSEIVKSSRNSGNIYFKLYEQDAAWTPLHPDVMSAPELETALASLRTRVAEVSLDMIIVELSTTNLHTKIQCPKKALLGPSPC